MALSVNDANFKQEVLESKVAVLVDFWAPWCGPCQIVGPVIEEVSKEYEGKIKVCKVNVDDAPKTASSYGIMSIPTLAVFKSGKVVKKTVGAQPKNELEAMIRPYI